MGLGRQVCFRPRRELVFPVLRTSQPDSDRSLRSTAKGGSVSRGIDQIREGVFALNQVLGRFAEAVWLVGDGRSGTTWLSEALQAAVGFRTVFEPFHPQYIPVMRRYPLFPYVRPRAEEPHLAAFAHDVFSGRFATSRVDAGNKRLLYNGLLVKDIFAHLFLAWADVQFPDVKKVLLLRHPFAVALSKRRLHKKNWVWMTEPSELLNRTELVDDCLEPFEDVIRGAQGFFEKQIVLWAVVHYVPFRQLTPEKIHLAFYEELCADPVDATNNVLDAIGRQQIPAKREQALRDRLRKPSSTSGSSHRKRDLVGWWRNELEPHQIDRGVAILDQFGLANVYNDATLPDHRAATRILEMPPE